MKRRRVTDRFALSIINTDISTIYVPVILANKVIIFVQSTYNTILPIGIARGVQCELAADSDTATDTSGLTLG